MHYNTNEYTIMVGHNCKASDCTLRADLVTAVIDYSLAVHGITGYTLIQASGSWNSEREPTSVVMIVESASKDAAIRAAAARIKDQLQQECVAVITKPAYMEFV